MRRHARVLVVVVAAFGAFDDGLAKAGHYVLAAQPRIATSVPTWNGSVRCEIDVKGPGYLNHLTHTWTLTGALPPDGNVLDYPGTWTVSGEGSLKPAATPGPTAAWKTQGSAPGVRMAIFVRQSDQRLLVFLRHGQLSAPNATSGTQEAAPIGSARARSQPIATPATEWRPFPTIVDAPTSTHITGSSVTPITNRLDALQPLGSEGQAACTWDLVQGVATVASASTAPGAAAGAAGGGGAAAGGGATAGAGTASAGGAAPGGGNASAGAAGAAGGRTSAAGLAGAGRASGGAAAGGAAASGTAGGGAAAASGATVTGPGAAGGVAAGAAGAAGANASSTSGSSAPPAPVALGCDADLPVIACQLNLVDGSTLLNSANFHAAYDTSDWFAVTGIVASAPFAVMDFSLTGGTSDGTYAIDVNEGVPGNLTLLATSGAAHAPKTTVSWATASATSKKLLVQVRHVAGPPSNEVYTLRLSLNGSQTVPLTVVPLAPSVVNATLPAVTPPQSIPVNASREQRERSASPPAAPQATAVSAASLLAPVSVPRLPLSVTPNTTAQNRPSVAVTLTGQNTHFVQGTTTATFHFSGSPTSVPLTVASPTTATAQLTLPAGTATGRFTVSLTTGLEVAEAFEGFTVTPTPDFFPNTCNNASSTSVNLVSGQTQIMTGVIEAAGVADFFQVAFTAGTSVSVTLSNADGSASDFQLEVYSSCGSPIGAPTTGGGLKTADLPDSGPHTVILRVSASPWNVARPMYRLRLEGR